MTNMGFERINIWTEILSECIFKIDDLKSNQIIKEINDKCG
jgi:hypothetical protein